MLNATHLATLCEVLSTGSFAEAASNLGYTQSAVSQQIHALERSTGLALFERRARSIVPTRAALLLRERSERVLAELIRLESQAADLAAGESGLIRIGAFPTAGATLVPNSLARFIRRRPQAKTALEEAEPSAVIEPLEAGWLDMALIYEYENIPGQVPREFERIQLLTDNLFAILPPAHRLALSSQIDLRELADETWITGGENSLGSINLERACAAAAFTPSIAYRTDDYDVVRELVQAGLGVALVPRLALLGRTHPLHKPVADSAGARHVLIVHKPSNSNPLLAPMIEAFKRTVAAMDLP